MHELSNQDKVSCKFFEKSDTLFKKDFLRSLFRQHREKAVRCIRKRFQKEILNHENYFLRNLSTYKVE